MTTKQKIAVGLAAGAGVLVVLGYATFEQWSIFVTPMVGALL
ncbi:MAG: hypothetical protein ACREO4_06285 [Lysobacter sp.]